MDASRRKLRRPPLFSGLTELITQQSNPLKHRLDLVAPSASRRRKRPRIPNFPKNRLHQLAPIPSHPAELARPSLLPSEESIDTPPTPHSDRKGLCTIPRSVFSTNEPPPSPPHHQATPRLAFQRQSFAKSSSPETLQLRRTTRLAAAAAAATSPNQPPGFEFNINDRTPRLSQLFPFPRSLFPSLSRSSKRSFLALRVPLDKAEHRTRRPTQATCRGTPLRKHSASRASAARPRYPLSSQTKHAPVRLCSQLD